MSTQYGKLCSVIIKEVFGDIVCAVADVLFESSARTLGALIKTTGLTRLETISSLEILIKFRLVDFKKCINNENQPEYYIHREQIIYILRFPKYVYLMQTKFGHIGATITEELLHSGCQSTENLLIKCFQTVDNKDSLVMYRDVFYKMITENYLIKINIPQKSNTDNNEASADCLPIAEVEEEECKIPPSIDLVMLQAVIAGKCPDKKFNVDFYWKFNYNRLHLDFMDSILISAIDKKIGVSAGECFKFILKQMYFRFDITNFKNYSNPLTYADIKHLVDKQSNNIDLIKYLDNYVTLIAEDSLGFMTRVGDTGGGQYIINLKLALENLAITCIENVITEKFGSKASRIFRVIKSKSYIEQEDLQKEAMIPAKEAKLLTYNLFQEQFIQIKTIRKAGGGGSGPSKAFFLFYLDTNKVVKMLLDNCYKSLYNAIIRSTFEKNENIRLIEKSQKLESIVDTMKERGESDEYISEILETLTPPERDILENVKIRIKTLSNAELVLEDTIFMLKLYQNFSTNENKTLLY